MKTRTRYENRIHAHLADLNLASPKTDLFGKQGRLWLATIELPEKTRFQVDLLLEMLDELELRIRRVGKRIEQTVAMTPEARLLKSVPGIGDRPDSSSGPRSAPSSASPRATSSAAAIAAARKLCCYLYWMLRDELTYPEWVRNRQQHHSLEVRPS